MISERLGHGTELPLVHVVNFVIPARQLQSCHILVDLLIEYVGQLHRQIVGFL